MKKGLGCGVFLMFVGIIALLIQFDVIKISILFFFFSHFMLVVSMILIVNGINIIFKKHNYIKFVTWMSFFAIIFAMAYYEDKSVKIKGNDITKPFIIEKEYDVKKGEFNFTAGGTSIKVSSAENSLVEGDLRSQDIEYDVKYQDNNEKVKLKFGSDISFELFDSENFTSLRRSNIDNPGNIYLNRDIVWDINMETGAMETEMNLLDLKVEKMNVSGGFGRYKVILGDNCSKTDLNISGGFSSFEIHVPKNSGLRVNMDGALNSVDFKNIDPIKNGDTYETSGYNKSETKINMNIELGLCDLEIVGVD